MMDVKDIPQMQRAKGLKGCFCCNDLHVVQPQFRTVLNMVFHADVAALHQDSLSVKYG